MKGPKAGRPRPDPRREASGAGGRSEGLPPGHAGLSLAVPYCFMQSPLPKLLVS